MARLPSTSRLVWTLLAILVAAGLAAVFWAVGDRLSVRLAGNSLAIALATVMLTLPPATGVALLLFRTDLLGKRALTTLLVVWLFLPVYVHIAGWRDLFGPQGWIALDGPGGNWIDGWSGVVWLHAVAAFPWAVLLLGVALRRGPALLEEDARLDISPLAVLWKVTLRRSIDGLLVAAVWIVITVFGEMSIASVCNVRTYAEVVFTGIPLGQTPTESTLAIAPGAVLCVLLVLLAAWLAHTAAAAALDIEVRRAAPLPLGRQRWLLSALVWLVFLAGLAPAVAGLVYKVGVTVDQIDGQFVRGWSLWKGLRLTLGSVVVYRTELSWTAALSVTVALATTLLGLVLCEWGIHRRARFWVVLLACAALFAIPGPVVGTMVAWLVNRPVFYGLAPLIDRTIFAPTLAVLTVTLPLVTFFYGHTLARERLLREMAALDGSRWWTTWRRVILPCHWQTILAGSLMALVWSANDIAASVLVLPAGIDTISRRIFGLLHFGGEDNVAGILLMNLLTVALVAGLIGRLAGSKGRSDSAENVP